MLEKHSLRQRATVCEMFGSLHQKRGRAAVRKLCSSSAKYAVIRKYLQDGIFYVKNPNNLPTARTSLSGKINIPTSVDAAFANGGMTASGGHPLGVVRRNLERGAEPDDWAEGGFYFIIDTLADLDRKWEKILAGKPDFIKTYLQYSQYFGQFFDGKSPANQQFFARFLNYLPVSPVS